MELSTTRLHYTFQNNRTMHTATSQQLVETSNHFSHFFKTIIYIYKRSSFWYYEKKWTSRFTHYQDIRFISTQGQRYEQLTPEFYIFTVSIPPRENKLHVPASPTTCMLHMVARLLCLSKPRIYCCSLTTLMRICWSGSSNFDRQLVHNSCDA